jgi:hypothetical protein
LSKNYQLKNLSGASLKFCQFPPQPAKVPKAAFYFVHVTENQIAAIRASRAAIDIPEYVRNDWFCGTEQITYLAIAQPARDQEHCLELHWRQETRQRVLDGFAREEGF